MRLGASADLRRRLFPGLLSTVAACSSPLLNLNSLRRVHGGMGRGDLFYVNPEAGRHNKRTLGQLRGLRHSTQATAPESGQLHYRKFMLHAMGEGPRSGSEQYRHPTCTWTYLMPSLMHCAELTINETLWKKLCLIEMEGNSSDTTALSEYEFHCVHSGQNLFRYELHQRLPLLEDSVASAGLQEVLNWFSVARRAWVRLPITSSATVSSQTEGSVCHVALAESSLLPSRDVLSSLTVPVASRDTTPGRHQTYDMATRLAQLTEVVMARAHDELTRLNDTDEKGKKKSVRMIAKEKKLRQRFVDDLRWHGITPLSSSSQ